MKKGVIVSKEDGKAVAMTESGDFVDIPDKGGLEIGETVRLTPRKAMIAAIAAALFLFANLFGWGVYGGVRTYFAPVTYLALDINPSVEFTLNRAKKVVSAKGNNREGKLLVAGVDFVGQDACSAAAEVVRMAAEVGYFSLEEPTENQPVNAVMLTVANDDEEVAQAVTETVSSAVNGYFDSVGIYSLILTYNLNPEFLKPEAQLSGVDLGKYQLVKLVSSCGIPFEEAKRMPVCKLNRILTETYGDTQKLLDAEAERLKQEREARKAKYAVALQAQAAELDRQAFLERKKIFWLEKAENMYEFCMKWAQYKSEWETRNSVRFAELTAA